MKMKHGLCSTALFLVLAGSLFLSGSAHTSHIKWTNYPEECFRCWQMRHKIRENDSLEFIYEDGTDSVLVVNQADFNFCNTEKPLEVLDSGDSSFYFNRTGAFYFISGVPGHCRMGEKLSVDVLPMKRHKSHAVVAAPAPLPVTLPAPAPLPVTLPAPVHLRKVESPPHSPEIQPTSQPITFAPLQSPAISEPFTLSPLTLPAAAEAPEEGMANKIQTVWSVAFLMVTVIFLIFDNSFVLIHLH